MRLALLCLALLACDPYDPDLGDIPFQCGTEAPRCPEGYVAVEVTAIRCECEKASIAPDPDEPYECSQDPQEANDTRATAFDTGVSGVTPQTQGFLPASICPEGDEDFYRLTAPTAGTIIRADIAFDTARQPPTVEILHEDGSNGGSATVSFTAGQLVTTYTAPRTGTYFVRVSADKEVNYQIARIMISF